MQIKNRSTVAGIFFGYFIMGLVDIVGISANYVKADFSLSDSVSSFLPLIAFISFAFLAVPSGMLMNRIGRKNSVLASFIITLIALSIPITGYTFPAMLTTFALVGIGNTVMQTSINPLLADVVPENKLTSSLTLGQFFRSVSSAIGPILVTTIMLLTGNWKNTFPIYAVITVIGILWLYKSPVTERNTDDTKKKFLSIHITTSKRQTHFDPILSTFCVCRHRRGSQRLCSGFSSNTLRTSFTTSGVRIESLFYSPNYRISNRSSTVTAISLRKYLSLYNGDRSNYFHYNDVISPIIYCLDFYFYYRTSMCKRILYITFPCFAIPSR